MSLMRVTLTNVCLTVYIKMREMEHITRMKKYILGQLAVSQTDSSLNAYIHPAPPFKGARINVRNLYRVPLPHVTGQIVQGFQGDC